MKSSLTKRILGIGVAVAAMVGLTAAPAYAKTTVEKVDIPSERFFYDNVVTGDGQPPYILLAGGDFGDFCDDEPHMETHFIKVKGTPPEEGATLHERWGTRVEMALYDLEGMDAFVWLGTYCPAYFATGATPERLAHGAGSVMSNLYATFHGAEAPDVWTENSARGVLKTPDGETLVVRGVAELTFEPVFSVDHVSLEILNR